MRKKSSENLKLTGHIGGKGNRGKQRIIYLTVYIVDKTGFKSGNKNLEFKKSYNRQETVESPDRQRLEGTRHIDEAEPFNLLNTQHPFREEDMNKVT